MKNKKKILTVIPARQNSKRLRDKNIKLWNGKPLIHWTIKSALKSKYDQKIIFSSDSTEYNKIALKSGANVPFVRPRELAKDNIQTKDVVINIIKYFEKKNIFFDLILLLQPTSPLRSHIDIDKALDIFFKKNLNSLVSANRTSNVSRNYISFDNKNIFKKYITDSKIKIENEAILNGSIYICDMKNFLKYKNFILPKTYVFLMEKHKSIDIDNIFDFYLSEIIKKNVKKFNKKI